MTTQANDERTPTRIERLSELHILLGQLSGLAWWMSDYRGDFEIDPDAVRHTGMLIERLGKEAKRHVEALEQEPQGRTGP